MKAAITISLFFLVISSFGQQDSTESKPWQLGYTEIERESYLINPVFIIKGEDIRRFPTLNFLEAVNGLFPWVFSFEPNANDFLFVVDGNILADINAISLYNIEEVAFVRGGLEAGNYPFAKRGSFIIRTKSKSASASFEFNANTGLVYLKNGSPFRFVNSAFYRYDSARSKGVQQNYQLSYSGKKGKASYFLSGNFAHDQNPPVFLQQVGPTVTDTFNYKQRVNVARFYAATAVPILPSLLFDFQGIADVQRAKIYSSSSYTQGNFLTVKNSVLPERYYTLYSSLNWTINKSFSNKFSFAYSNNNERTKMESTTTSDLPDLVTGSTTDTSKVKRGYIESNTAYESAGNRTWKIKAGLLLRYNFLHFRKGHLGLIFVNDQLNSTEGSIYRDRVKIITGVPYITLNFKNLLSLYGGLQLFVRDLEFGRWGVKNGSKRLPYGGAVFSVMNLFSQKKVMNRFDLGINYSVRNNNLTDYYRLEKKETPDQLTPAFVYTPDRQDDFLKDKIFSVQATAGFLEDRFMIGTEWFKGKDGRYFALSIPTAPGPSVIYVPGDVDTKGISVFGKAQLLQSKNYSWSIRANAVKQDRKIPYNLTQREIYYPVAVGLQNSLSIGDFFAQMTTVMGFDKEIVLYTSGFPGPSEKVDDLSVSHILLGYKLSLNKKWISDMQVFAQAKNIIASKTKRSYEEWPRYIGMGLNVVF